jgi:hypothetical protein
MDLNHLIKSTSNNPLSLSILPLCHTLKNKNAINELLNEKILKKEFCDVFKEYLLYFFYGKAPFTDHEIYKDSRPGFYPITILFDISKIPVMPIRMYPFDTGGYNRYNISLPRDSFAIKNPTIEEVLKFIYIVFENNTNYISKKFKANTSKYPTCMVLKELEILYAKLWLDIPMDYGDQAFAVEIQYKDIDIENPIAFVVPHRLAINKENREFWHKDFPNTIIIPYDDKDTKISKLYDNMQSQVRRYISKNYIKKD